MCGKREGGDRQARLCWAGQAAGGAPSLCARCGRQLACPAPARMPAATAPHLLAQRMLPNGPRTRDGGVADNQAVHPLLQRNRRDVCGTRGVAAAAGRRAGCHSADLPALACNAGLHVSSDIHGGRTAIRQYSSTGGCRTAAHQPQRGRPASPDMSASVRSGAIFTSSGGGPRASHFMPSRVCHRGTGREGGRTGRSVRVHVWGWARQSNAPKTQEFLQNVGARRRTAQGRVHVRQGAGKEGKPPLRCVCWAGPCGGLEGRWRGRCRPCPCSWGAPAGSRAPAACRAAARLLHAPNQCLQLPLALQRP